MDGKTIYNCDQNLKKNEKFAIAFPTESQKPVILLYI